MFGDVPAELSLPRRASPRLKVPAGSLAIATTILLREAERRIYALVTILPLVFVATTTIRERSTSPKRAAIWPRDAPSSVWGCCAT